MSNSNDLTNLAIKANAIYSCVTANSSGIVSFTIGNTVINSTSITVTTLAMSNADYGLVLDPVSGTGIDYGTVP